MWERFKTRRSLAGWAATLGVIAVVAALAMFGLARPKIAEMCPVPSQCDENGNVIGTVTGVPGPYPRAFDVFVTEHTPGSGDWVEIPGSRQTVTARSSTVEFGPLDISQVSDGVNSIRVEQTATSGKSDSFAPCPHKTSTPTKTATPTNTSTATPTNTHTPTPTHTFTPTATNTNTPVPPSPTPTNTPVPLSPTPENTNTPAPPSPTPTGTSETTPTPTATEEHHHHHTRTPEPTETPQATDIPQPTATSTRTREVVPAVITRQPAQPAEALPHAGSPGEQSSPAATIAGSLSSVAGFILLLSGLRLARRQRKGVQ